MMWEKDTILSSIFIIKEYLRLAAAVFFYGLI